MKHTLMFIIITILSTGCSTITAGWQKAKELAFVQDLEALVQATKDKDVDAFYNEAVNLAHTYVTVVGAPTLLEEYGPECVLELEVFFGIDDLENIAIIRNSKIIAKVEQWGALSEVRAMTLTKDIILVGRDKVLNVPHEITHVRHHRVNGSTFPVQYLPTVLFLGGSGYEKSVFEVEAREMDAAFRVGSRDVCGAAA